MRPGNVSVYTVDEIITNAQQEIISTVTSNLKSAFDAEVEKILKKFDNFKQDKIKDEVGKVDFSQQIEQTHQRSEQIETLEPSIIELPCRRQLNFH